MGGKFDPLKDHEQLIVRERQCSIRVGGVRNLKPTLFESLVEKPKSVAIPVQNFQTIAAPVFENKQVPGCRVGNFKARDFTSKSIERFAHVGRCGEQIDC